MHVIFLSEKLAALSVSGLHLGFVDGFERTAELDPAEKHFIELKPMGFHAVRFCFDEAFLLDPPPQVDLYYTKTGVAIYCHGFLREDGAMRVVRQERVGDARFTLLVQGRVQLSMENSTGFHLIDLPDCFENAAISAHGECYLLEGEGAFCILSQQGEILVRAEGAVTERGEVLQAEIPFHDSMGHSALCSYQNGQLSSCSVRTAREPTEATYALALFESALIGGDCKPFLSDSLQEKAGALKEFLGNYRSVVLTDKPNEVGLVYPRKRNVFDVRYFHVTMENGKIANIAESE